jgi:hypothetical protein
MIRSAAPLALLVSSLLAAPSQAKESCPAPAQAPTPEQRAEGTRNAKDRGALWKIAKDGRTSYLYGTIHIGRVDWIFPGPKLMSALRNTGVIAVEVDLTAPGTQQEMMTAMATAPALPLTDGDRARLAKLAEAECVPPGAFDAFDVSILPSFASRPASPISRHGRPNRTRFARCSFADRMRSAAPWLRLCHASRRRSAMR